MADVSKISLYGTSYNIKDTTGRQSASEANNKATQAASAAATAQKTANDATTLATTNSERLDTLSGESLKVAYDSSTETIGFTKGISTQAIVVDLTGVE